MARIQVTHEGGDDYRVEVEDERGTSTHRVTVTGRSVPSADGRTWVTRIVGAQPPAKATTAIPASTCPPVPPPVNTIRIDGYG